MRNTSFAITVIAVALLFGYVSTAVFFRLIWFGPPTPLLLSVPRVGWYGSLVLALAVVLGIVGGQMAKNASAPIRIVLSTGLGLAVPLLVAVCLLAVAVGSSMTQDYFLNRPSIQVGDSRRAVMERMNFPSSIDTAPNFTSLGHQLSECDKNEAKEGWVYSTRSGSFRIVYFDADGRVLCVSNGRIAF